MDLNRYKKITWQEAISKLENGEHIFTAQGHSYFMKDGKLCYSNVGSNSEDGRSSIVFNHFMEREWYIKKPFDVRTEMLARPNEWVGAFKDNLNRWHKIGLDSRKMVAIETRYEVIKPNWNDDRCEMAALSEIDRCIPIEDVTKEDLQ